ncbi:MAG: hypothetical protein ABIY70_04765 [Capsulimonas sp.]|uniref:hypothetical protein n=1 Tax=Capsulimonas sp. TaxID=2494211 RepID=UPI003263778C
MDEIAEDDNWLNASFLNCQNCQVALYRVDHSGFHDCHFLYCDSCAICAEVDFYDPVYAEINRSLVTDAGKSKYRLIMDAIEERLKPCDCGGKFLANAARRCYSCAAVVLQDTPDVDLYPALFGVDPDEHEITEQEEQAAEEFQAKFVRTEDLWKP